MATAPRTVNTTGFKLAFTVGSLVVLSVAALAIGGFTESAPAGGENEVQEFLGGGMGFTSLIALFVSLFLGWAWVSVRLLFGLAEWRMELHYWIAWAALSAALVHGIGLMEMGDLRGWLSGWLATGAIVALLVTGWRRTTLIKNWGTTAWRWVHWELAVAAIALSLEHWALIEATKGG